MINKFHFTLSFNKDTLHELLIDENYNLYKRVNDDILKVDCIKISLLYGEDHHTRKLFKFWDNNKKRWLENTSDYLVCLYNESVFVKNDENQICGYECENICTSQYVGLVHNRHLYEYDIVNIEHHGIRDFGMVIRDEVTGQFSIKVKTKDTKIFEDDIAIDEINNLEILGTGLDQGIRHKYIGEITNYTWCGSYTI